MYKYVFSFLIFCLTLTTISSCSNEPLEGDFGQSDNEVEDPNADATFRATLEENVFEAQQITAILDENGLLISGRTGNQELSINIANPETGSFTLSNSSQNVFVTYTSNRNVGQPFFTATSGQLNITNYNEEIGLISGNFAGILSEFVGLAEDIEMTNGVFQEIRFVEVTEVEDPPAPGNGDENGEEDEEDSDGNGDD